MEAGRFQSLRVFFPVLWCIGLGLLLNALVFAWPRANADDSSSATMPEENNPALTNPVGAQIQVIPTQIGPSNWGFVLVDPQRHNLAVYEIYPDISRLRLIAARDFQDDLNLHDFNNSSPTPAQVKMMLNPNGGPEAQ